MTTKVKRCPLCKKVLKDGTETTLRKKKKKAVRPKVSKKAIGSKDSKKAVRSKNRKKAIGSKDKPVGIPVKIEIHIKNSR